MELENFKKLHFKFSKLPLSKEVWQTDEYSEYIEALHSSKDLYEWTLVEKFTQQKFAYHKYCCLTMADKVLDSKDSKGETRYDDPDVVINKWDNNTFGIPIHDGGASIIEINFCPWCGENLKNERL